MVDMRNVVLGLKKDSGGYSSVGGHSFIGLRYVEGAGWTDSKAGEGFNVGMRRFADSLNHIVILTGEVDRHEAQTNAYGKGRMSLHISWDP